MLSRQLIISCIFVVPILSIAQASGSVAETVPGSWSCRSNIVILEAYSYQYTQLLEVNEKGWYVTDLEFTHMFYDTDSIKTGLRLRGNWTLVDNVISMLSVQPLISMVQSATDPKQQLAIDDLKNRYLPEGALRYSVTKSSNDSIEIAVLAHEEKLICERLHVPLNLLHSE